MLESCSRFALTFVLGVSIVACTAVTIPDYVGRRAPAGAGTEGDVCAPGNAPDVALDPLALCAKRDEVRVPDVAGAAPVAGNLQTSSLRPLDGPALPKAAPKSCAGKAGPGLDTCGASGNGDCCQVANVPAGKAGLLEVASFDLGVYEVTSGRFAQFVAATNGDLQGAARAGNWPGWKPEWTAQLPASRAEVDTQLGPACKFGSNPRDYGARTWPSPDVEAAVDEQMKDQNDRAADIRADARPARLMQKPLNCTSFAVAAAFCAWDGGRLPHPDEWAYAALGGEELRKYPWGNDLDRRKMVSAVMSADGTASVDFTYPEGFPFFANGMNAYHIAPPGRKPLDRGRWGHFDLGGNLVEWTDTGNVTVTTTVRGGSWEGHPAENVTTFGNYDVTRTYRSVGFRCAYGAAPAPKPGGPDPVAAGGMVDVRRALGPAEPIAFRVPQAEPAGGGVRLYACGAPGAGRASPDATCGGQGAGAPLGFAYAKDAVGLLPLYQCGDVSTPFTSVCKARGAAITKTSGFVAAPPPSAWLREVYQAALGRDVEQGGHEYWLAQIDAAGCGTASLAAVTRGVVLSQEAELRKLSNEERVTAIFRAGLGRAPDAAGLAWALDWLGKGGTFPEYADMIVGSPEFATYSAARCAK